MFNHNGYDRMHNGHYFFFVSIVKTIVSIVVKENGLFYFRLGGTPPYLRLAGTLALQSKARRGRRALPYSAVVPRRRRGRAGSA